MKKTLLLLSACLFYVGQAVADNVLTVGDVNLPQGGEATLEVGCDFETEYTAFELQLTLPEGVTLKTDVDGYPVIEKAFDANHVLTGKLLPSNGNYKITCRSMENLSMPTSGALFRVTLVADPSLTLGASLNASVTACEFTRTADSQGELLSDINFTINITEFRTILDETSTEAPSAATGVDVRVKRTINADQWSTICLPFAMTAEQCQAAFGSDVQLGDFTGYETTEDGDAITGINVKFTSATAIEANHPYIIKVSQAVSEFTADGVDINPDEAKVEYDNGKTGKQRKVLGTFAGTYTADFDFYNEATYYPLFLSGNRFYYATENTKHMKAFRAYFDFQDYLEEAEYAEARVFIVFGDETTGIGSVQRENAGDDRYYNLSGLRVEQPSKGLYIKNGKKVIMK